MTAIMDTLEKASNALASLCITAVFIGLLLLFLGVDPTAAHLATIIFLITSSICGAVNFALSWFVKQ